MSRPLGARLTVSDGHGQRVIAIDKPTFRIGRRPDSDLVLTGGEVSRNHAQIVQEGDHYIIRDRQSKYGTYVNGARVIEQALAHRDQIECGHGGAALMFLTEERERTDDSRAGALGELRQVATLLAALRAMGTERVLDEVLAVVLDAAIEMTRAERGFIMLADRQTGVLDLSVARRAGRISLEPSGFQTSRKIPEQVFETGQLQVANLLEGDLPNHHTQTIAFGIRHVLCAPLRLVRYVERNEEEPATSANIGVLYLDSSERGRFSSSVSVAVEALATEAATAIENARLYRSAVEKAKLDEELRTASKIQQALLPEPRREGPFYAAVGASVPSRMIGGDFFDYLDLSDGAFGFAIGDVTGKGPSAALVTAVIQGIFGSHAATSVTPGQLISLVNRVLLSRRIESRLATIFFGLMTPSGRLTYCNGAQNPPLLFSGATWERLEIGGTLVGAFPNTVYEQGEHQLKAGDTIVLFSDGIVEALNVEGEEFGEQRIREAVEPRMIEPVDRILDRLLAALEEFTRGIPQADDLTAVVVRYLG